MSGSTGNNDVLKRFFLQQGELYGDDFWAEKQVAVKEKKNPKKPAQSSPKQQETVSEQPAEYGDGPEIFTKPGNPALREMYEEIRECLACPLGETRTKFVFGGGNPNADLMFVGEAPGRDEDRTGIPFVGQAGKLLDTLLEEIGLGRSDVFIANILKCRPPKNRDPNPVEVQKCLPYLKMQIDLIAPKMIVALGRISAQRLLETDLPMSKMRGRMFSYNGVDMMVVYHPAAILYNRNLMDTMRGDMQRIADLYRGQSDR